MKQPYSLKNILFLLFIMFPFLLISQNGIKEYKGKVLDENSKKGLEYVSVTVENTNVSTVTNSEGEFLLKVPIDNVEGNIKFSLLGYQTKVIALSLLKDNDIIFLSVSVTQLSEVNIQTYKSAENLLRSVLKNKQKTQINKPLAMTAFYRETIKRRNRNVSLTEAVLHIKKQPYNIGKPDVIKLGKARKRTDYKRLDTITLKLQGGPFSALYLDMMKYPEYIFTNETIDAYNFSFGESTTIENKAVQTVNFSTKSQALNINYKGKLFIDVANLALVSADYYIDLGNKTKSKNLLVKKKPRNVVVYPLEANYKVDYRFNNGKWQLSYSTFNLKFKVNKKREIFNKVYTLSSELAITDWEIDTSQNNYKAKERLKPNIIIADAISGFSDADFWGEFNVIGPDKSIESAIEKIKRHLKRSN